jgi:hypothetical protein
MNTQSILIVVDTEGALASGSLMNNVYIVDTNKYLGSWQEGTDSLHTVCQDGQTLNWRVTSVNNGNDVEISEFNGDMVTKQACVPAKLGLSIDVYWAGLVQTKGIFASYPYTITLSINDKTLSFSPFIKVV